MQTAKSLTWAAVSVVLLSGCVTPYQPMGFAGGYRDTEVAPGIIRIEVRGNAFTSVQTLESYFHRRASAICHPHKYDWRLDSGATRDPSSFVIKPGYGRSTVVTERPGAAKGWVTGAIMCTDEAPGASTQAATPAASAEAGVLVIDVVSGKVANIPEDVARSQVATSHRLALVTGGKVEAVSPEGSRVQVDVEKAGDALSLGYRLLSGAELEAEAGAAAR
jgi:hypothetical protein